MAFGMPIVIDAVLWMIRIWLCWQSVFSFDRMVELCNGQLSVVEMSKAVMGCLGVHLWWALGEVL